MLQRPRASFVGLAICISLYSSAASAQNATFICQGTNQFLYICQGTNHYSKIAELTYNVMVRGELSVSVKASRIEVIKYMNSKWSFNKPRDTWRCNYFDTASSWENYAKYLSDREYMAYYGDGNKEMNEAFTLPRKFFD